MKVCILSMQNVENMGSLLQAYSLKKNIENMGNDVKFIPIRKIDEDNKLMDGYFDSFPQEVQNKQGLARLKKFDKYFLNRVKNIHLRKKQFQIYADFRDKYLGIKQLAKMPDDGFQEQYDCCVIGSDEVFNCCVRSAWGFTSQLFGNVENAKHVITYAASCGSTESENVPNPVKNKIKNAMERLEGISVRDFNTKKFVNDIAGLESEVYLDPVLIEKYDEELKKCWLNITLPKHYCVVYSYDNRIHLDEEIQAIMKFCKHHDLTPVCVGIPQFWIKNYIICDPFQCLVIFRNADFVITDTFHGTIFSSKNCSKFSVVVRDSNRNKLQYLIDTLQLGEHQMESISLDELERTFRLIHTKDTFYEILKVQRKRSLNYLETSFRNVGRNT